MAVVFSCGWLVNLDCAHVSLPGPKTRGVRVIFSAQQEFELEEGLQAN
jgi:hypothetical protein